MSESCLLVLELEVYTSNWTTSFSFSWSNQHTQCIRVYSTITCLIHSFIH